MASILGKPGSPGQFPTHDLSTVWGALHRYSSFDPDLWWKTRSGVRTEIVELQKLVLEVVLHPISF
jgi:hypothetical protein